MWRFWIGLLTEDEAEGGREEQKRPTIQGVDVDCSLLLNQKKTIGPTYLSEAKAEMRIENFSSWAGGGRACYI